MSMEISRHEFSLPGKETSHATGSAADVKYGSVPAVQRYELPKGAALKGAELVSLNVRV